MLVKLGGKKGGTNYSRCIRLDGPAARCSGRPKLPRQFVPVRNFEPRLFVPMPGNMGRPAFTFIASTESSTATWTCALNTQSSL